MNVGETFQKLGGFLPEARGEGPVFCPVSPVDGSRSITLPIDSADDLDEKVAQAARCFEELRTVPAPLRGECVRRFGLSLRHHAQELAALVTWESGKIFQEALGEVQEMVDICDFAVGLSRQVGGSTLPSERQDHRMMEQWHPLGPVGVISAFNFPVAVWAWNAALAVCCGDPVVWKPSQQTPLSALACHQLLLRAASEIEGFPRGISQLVLGGADLGAALADDRRLPLISATGSTAMGREVGVRVAQRLGRSLLELGGNNALIVTPSARLPLALRAIVFSAVGTAGQRCTSLRRLIVHRSKLDELVSSLVEAYRTLKVGDPFDRSVHVGPVIGPQTLALMQRAIQRAQEDGGTLLVGGERVLGPGSGTYVKPAIVSMPHPTELLNEECFAPLLYVLPYDELEQAIAMQNAVPQGLSSAIFTESVRDAELFLGAKGSDCGIANVNIGTSGAEIGGAFGGEKDTGGGRESGSDAWKNYMRRATNTINYGSDLPLAQGIEFQHSSTD